MSKIIEEEIKIEKVGEKYHWKQSLITENSEEEIQKMIDHMYMDKDKLEELILERKDVRKLVQTAEQKLKQEYEVKLEGLNNYNKYWAELEAKEEERKIAEKKNLKAELNNYESIKKQVVERVKKQYYEEKQAYTEQLRIINDNLEVILKGFKVEDEIKKENN